ncbi:MAG: hypothetical protein U0904_02070 [Candidatus Nanopelagicales bacterium]|nr:hypothetical protein [Candidatus Nanopelagicales bacterium]
MMSTASGHVQLRNRLDPTVLYTEPNYAFRSDRALESGYEMSLFEEFILVLRDD